MKTRIIAAAVLVPVLFLIVLVAPESAAAAILGILLAIASYELLYRTGLVKHPRLVVYSSVMAFALSMWSYFGAVRAYFVLMLMVYAMVLFAEFQPNEIGPGIGHKCHDKGNQDHIASDIHGQNSDQ